MDRKLACAAAVAGILATVPVLAAETYPARMVKMVVPSIAGSAPDIIARLVAERLTAAWGQQVVVENRPAGNGIAAMQELAQAAPDGYTLGLFHAAAAVTTPVMYKEARFDIERDAETVATIAYTPMLFVANAQAPYRNVAEILAAAKAKPDDVVIGSPRRGSIPHLTSEMMGQYGHARFRQIGFSGTTQAIQALIKGDIPLYVDGTAPLLPLVRSGRIKAIAVTADEALPGLEGIPLAKDAVPGTVASGWFAMFAPKGTPQAVIDRTSADVNAALRQGPFVTRLAELGTYPMIKSHAQARDFIRSEKKRWEEVIAEAGVKPE